MDRESHPARFVVPVLAAVVAAAIAPAALHAARDRARAARDASSPQAFVRASASGNPLVGARFFVDPYAVPARLARRYRRSHPNWARLMRVIAQEPGTARFARWAHQRDVAGYLNRAAREEPGTIPMISTIRWPHGHCGHNQDPPSEQRAYHRWMLGFARGIGAHRVVVFLEMDALITVGCLSQHGVDVRMHELHDAIDLLNAHAPRAVVYLDAGAADAIPPSRTASLLRRAGVAKIQGFWLNATHFDWTSKEIRYGEKISRMTGGKHFVVNTGENGRGPLIPRDRVHQGNEVLCNPSGRGLGPKPTSDTGYRNVDLFAWTSNPGESTGTCVPGEPPTGAYWPQYAMMLVRNADFRVR